MRISHKAGDLAAGVATYLLSDQLGSVRVTTGVNGASDKETIYRPFGETVDTITDDSVAKFYAIPVLVWLCHKSFQKLPAGQIEHGH